ncbi:hypothetical protein [Micromonospora sp. URMC 103]|uniref:hypothetical protein n=1 Tax=Micromonospora sp. URMC 103 TaxID=3423406 RepID=UPI003F1B6290
MNLGRFGDVVVGTAGDVAGSVVDPRQGLKQLRSARSARTGLVLAAGVVLGYLAARARRGPDRPADTSTGTGTDPTRAGSGFVARRNG